MTRLRSVTLVVLLVCSPIAAKADVVLDWNAIAVTTLVSQGQSPFAQARFMAITQLAVFEAVNAIKGDYKPYLGTVVAPAGASAEAAAVAAAYTVLKNYFPLAPNLDAAYAASLAAIPNGVGQERRHCDGSGRRGPNDRRTPQRRLVTGAVLHAGVDRPRRVAAHAKLPCRRRRQFSVAEHDTVRRAERSRQPGVDRAIRPGSAAGAHQQAIRRDYNEVKRVGNMSSDLDDRPQDRADVARFYAASSPSFVFNLAARQIAAARGQFDVEECADPRPAQYGQQRQPRRVVLDEVSLHSSGGPRRRFVGGNLDGNARTDGDITFVPYVVTPCFPELSVESRQRERQRRRGSEAGLRRRWPCHHDDEPRRAGRDAPIHRFNEITDDISDARVYGGIHFRFDQEAGAELGRHRDVCLQAQPPPREALPGHDNDAMTTRSTTGTRAIVIDDADVQRGFLHIGHDRCDILVGDQRQRKSANDVDEEEERLIVLHDLLERLRAMIVKVRSGLVDAAKLRDVEAIEHLIPANRLERLDVGEDGARIARLEHDARPVGQVHGEPLRREIESGTVNEAWRENRSAVG